MKIREYVKKYIQQGINVERMLMENCMGDIEKIINEIFETYYNRGGSVFLFGNGGSASCCEHIAEELLNRLQNYRVPLSALSLTSQPSIITGIANDFGFEKVFSRQLEALATPKDLVIALSTSGNSLNVINGIRLARLRGVKTIGMTGINGRNLINKVDICLTVPSDNTSIIQEAHMIAGHIICAAVEEMLFGEQGLDN
ncbi:SIS domain-containing protein [Candidatus Gottesmanbacteria bacterium]|nr:SIS domain-containing protein [Candidatus Gottesmanbacteria bacterium]